MIRQNVRSEFGKSHIGKLELLRPFDQLIPAKLEENAIEVLPIKIDHLSNIISLELHHRDPFDRLIIAQSIAEQISVITSDAAFTKYPVDIIW
ncbi:MAG: type II toxin-antitoxin system VapC family toxin [Desulfobacteraceae bacterium]|nr:type II toxin-antitoxin system VapC family toxin [Desulfobacteraceae bacterium]